MNGMGGAVISGIGIGGIQNSAPNSNGFNPSSYTAEKNKQAGETAKNAADLRNMMGH
jgi:hypothetical protein